MGHDAEFLRTFTPNFCASSVSGFVRPLPNQNGCAIPGQDGGAAFAEGSTKDAVTADVLRLETRVEPSALGQIGSGQTAAVA